MSHTEKTLDSTRIFDGVVVHLRRDTVQLEDGAKTIREVIDHPGGVSILARDREERSLFVRQFRYPFGRTLLELPAGKLEPGEDPADSGRRELKEETGCTAGRFVPMGQLIPTCAYDTEVIHLFFCHRPDPRGTVSGRKRIFVGGAVQSGRGAGDDSGRRDCRRQNPDWSIQVQGAAGRRPYLAA